MKVSQALVLSGLIRAIDCLEETSTACLEDIVTAAQLIIEALRSGHKILLCGNGGSASLCQHLASEFVNGLTPRTATLPAIALTADTSTITAAANDFGYEHIFKRQVAALGKEGDVLLAISTSGGSKNVIDAGQIAQTKNIKVIALTGEPGGELLYVSCVAICVPPWGTQHIQEAHLAIGHILVALVERALWE